MVIGDGRASAADVRSTIRLQHTSTTLFGTDSSLHDVGESRTGS